MKGTIIKQLEAEAVKIRGLEDNRVIMENKVRESEKEKNQLLESIRVLKI